MNETVKLRKVGAALVMGIPKRIADAFQIKQGDFLSLVYNPVVGEVDRITVVKEDRGRVENVKRTGSRKRAKK